LSDADRAKLAAEYTSRECAITESLVIKVVGTFVDVLRTLSEREAINETLKEAGL